MSKPRVLAEPILVGREKELEELHSIFVSAVEGKGKTVFILGEAGSGKSRVAHEFLNRISKQGTIIMTGWCQSDAQVPYFPFMEAFNSYYAQYTEEDTLTTPTPTGEQSELRASTSLPLKIGVEAVPWLVAQKSLDITTRPETLSPQVWKDQAFAAVAKTLREIADQAPLVLFLEDIHWADSASLALLHYISRATHDSERVLVLATFRSEELTSDVEGHPHPLAETLRLMRREDLFAEIKLQSLEPSFVSKMAENMMGGALQTGLAEKLAAESKGNPLFVVESLRMLLERKSLLLENSQWRLAVDELGIPSKIKDIILRRLSCLNYAQRRVLDAASVIGEEFDFELLSTVLGQDTLEVLEILNVVAHSTSLIRAQENKYRFDHARSRETLYEELSPPLRRGYHNRIAEKLERTAGAALSDLAYHYAQAGNREKAIKYALEAGKDEVGKWSNTQAIKHFQHVLQNVIESESEEKRVALEGLGDAYAASYRYVEAIKIFDELAACEAGLVKLRAIRKASDAAFSKGDVPDLLIEYAKKAEEIGVSDRLELARIIDNRGHAWGFSKKVGEKRGPEEFKLDLADYQAALKVFEEENSKADTAEALRRSGLISVTFEDLREQGLGALLRSLALFAELGDVRKQITATLNLGEGFSGADLFEEERRTYHEVLRLGEKLDVFDELALASMYLSGFDEDDGKIEEALSRSIKALDYSMKTDAKYIRGTVYATLTRRYAMIGDLRNAEEYFSKLGPLQTEKYTPDFTMQSGMAVGIYFAATGQWEKSNQVFGTINKAFEEMDENYRKAIPAYEVFFRNGYAWALEKQGRLEEAKVQRSGVQSLVEQFEEEVEAKFGHANIQLSVMAKGKVQVGEEIEIRFDLVNVGRGTGTVAEIKNATLPGFNVTISPSFCNIVNCVIELNDKAIEAFKVKTIKLRVNVTKAGVYTLNPEAVYVDDLGRTKAVKTKSITITVQPAKPAVEILPGRITTGYTELDKLFMGGMPEKYAVVLAAPSNDERQTLIKRFLEAGSEVGELTLYLTCEATNAQKFADQSPTGFYMIVCGFQADLLLQNLPNAYKLKGVENLTDIDIALTRLFRAISSSQNKARRICIDIVSDVLLQHHATIARKWLSGLITSLKAKGFTTLAVVDPLISPEEVPAVLSLFDGEIRIAEKEIAGSLAKTLRISRLQGQSYLKDEVRINL